MQAYWQRNCYQWYRRRPRRCTWVPEDGMDGPGCQLTVRDVAPLLHGRYIIITGGKARNGSPIITFPDTGNFYNLNDNDYKNLILYLTSLPTINFIKAEKSHGLQESDLGFVLVIDRRQDRWSSVKTVLWKIAGFFPGLIQMVFVLGPMGFFQKAITEVGYKFVKDDFKFNVIMCNSVEELHEHIDKEQLIEGLNGIIVYNHEEWIEQRAAIEKFATNTREISQALRELMQRLQETEFPNDVPSTEVLIQERLSERNEIKEDLKSAVKHGETLLSCIRKASNEIESENGGSKSLECYPNKLINIATVDCLLMQLDETEKAFHGFWSKHYLRLQQCLQLRRFEQEFKELHVNIGRHLRAFSDMTETADSVSRSEQLIRELRQFELETKEDLDKADDLSSGGEHLIQNDHYAVDCIQPKCNELKEMCEEFHERLRKRYEVLHRTRDLQERIDKANKWCTRGMNLLATQQVEQLRSVEGAEFAVKEIEEFMTSSNEFKLNNPKEFRAAFESMIMPDTKALVQQVLKRIDDVWIMCDVRKNSLKKVIVKPPRPVQPVVPEPANPLHTSPVHSASLDSETKPAKKLVKKASLPKNLMHIEVLRDSDDSAGSHDSESEAQRDFETLENKRSFKNKKKVPGKNEKISAPSDISYPGLIMKELLDTERLYVYELRTVLEGYAKEMDRPDMLSLQPPAMRGKKDIIFGNLQQIHDFHANIFLKDLENYRNTPALVGMCFIQRKEEFQMYSMYCQNKPISEALRKQLGENNPFFEACQKRLGHKLPLGAYLLKPVQRITKYQLLLKEMLKYTAEEQAGYSELNEALSTMLSVLKYVNDIMHQVAITGFGGNLSDLGKLLMQGSFNVWAKKDKLRDLRFKPMQRHIFLYEKALLFCKKRDDAKDSTNYAFKHYLETRQIGLTENNKGDPRKFELWSHGRTEVYTIQAPTPQIKEAWVQEVKHVLLQQLDQLKGNHIKYYSERIRLSQQNGLQLSPRAKQSNWYQTSKVENSTCTNNNVTSDHREHVTLQHDQNNSTEDIFDDANWSDVCSDSDHDNSENFREHLVSIPMSRCVALCDYHATDDGEVTMQEGDIIELIKMSNDGWCYVHIIGTAEEGWAPASYLERLSKKHSRSSFSVNSGDSCNGSLMHAHSKTSVTSNASVTSQDAI